MDSIKKSSDFALVAKQGDKWFSDSFILQVLNREDHKEEDSRFGLIVSKKLGNAVARNFIKRRFREVVRLSFPKVIKGIDIVLIGRKTSKERSLQQMQSDFRWSLKRLKIIEGSKKLT